MNNATDLLTFARLHDWGQNARIVRGTLYVYDRYEKRSYTFRTMPELKAWAGY